MTPDDKQPDLVDVHYRPFVRALGNLVLTFALCEAELLGLVKEIRGGNYAAEREAVGILKAQDAKEQVLFLVHSIGLSGFALDELISGVEGFWEARKQRNRLIHDEWYPNFFTECEMLTRGLTREKQPQEVYGAPTVKDVWALAELFHDYDGLFSHNAYLIRRERDGDDGS